MGQEILPPSGGDDDHIQPVDLKAALEQRYLAYALSTIMHRALPDVRDGLKPVHRRIVYAMNEMGLRPNSAFRKCAKIVGEVMGNYHPHGDQSIYDALARLAQDFSQRYTLVNGQGNFGNIDGDSPAAMRYTRSKMTAVSNCCSKASIRMPSISETLTTNRIPSRSFFPAPSRTCSPTDRPASPSAWRPRSRRTMPTSFATQPCI